MRIDSIRTVLGRALKLGGAAGLAIGVISGLVGVAVAGPAGLASGLVGAALTVLFLGVTAGSVLAAGRLSSGDSLLVYGLLMGGWFVKLVVFLAVMLVLRGQPWVVPGVLFASIVATVIASLVIDAVVVGTARIPVTDRI